MGKQFDHIQPGMQEFISRQKIFFVGTAAPEGRVNVSPKGMDSLRVTAPESLVWLNLSGSGNETAAHILQNPRMTIMFCSFEQDPQILRLYGQAKMFHPGDSEFEKFAALFPGYPGARQIMELKVDLVQTSCGFGVPMMDYRGERDLLGPWAQKKGEDGLASYWHTRNARSIDGFPTDFSEE